MLITTRSISLAAALLRGADCRQNRGLRRVHIDNRAAPNAPGCVMADACDANRLVRLCVADQATDLRGSDVEGCDQPASGLCHSSSLSAAAFGVAAVMCFSLVKQNLRAERSRLDDHPVGQPHIDQLDVAREQLFPAVRLCEAGPGEMRVRLRKENLHAVGEGQRPAAIANPCRGGNLFRQSRLRREHGEKRGGVCRCVLPDQYDQVAEFPKVGVSDDFSRAVDEHELAAPLP